jgi:hypothetical protein
MTIFKKDGNKVKFLGITIYKICYKDNKISHYILGIPMFITNSKIHSLQDKFNKLGSFDTREIDREIAAYTYKLFDNKVTVQEYVNENRIAILATELYDSGGHTECLKSTVMNLSNDYEITTFLSKKNISYNLAPNKIQVIEKYSKIDGIDFLDFNFSKNLLIMFKKITGFAPRVIFIYMHMNDFFNTALIAMIKKYTKTKIIYFDHGSHFAALGFGFADLVLEGLPAAFYITKKYRCVDKCNVIGLFSDKAENIKYFSDEEIKNKKTELGIKEGNYLTLSGAIGYKLFDKNKSPYFEMIKKILEREKKLQHVLITSLSDSEKNIIENIFLNSESRSRLIFIPVTNDYEILFQSCDVFIDSFPISSALTQIDLMKFKKPTVVKINKENALWSFHEYMPKNYPYMFENVEDMENGIFKLLYDKNEREKIIKMNYKHFLTTFEGNVVKQKYVDFIENSDNLEQFYEQLDENLKYNLIGMK